MPDPIPALETNVPGRDGRAGLLLRAPYRAGLVADLKHGLPWQDRYWDEGIGAWWIDARESPRLPDIVLRHFAALAVLAGPGEEPTLLSREGTVPAEAQPP